MKRSLEQSAAEVEALTLCVLRHHLLNNHKNEAIRLMDLWQTFKDLNRATTVKKEDARAATVSEELKQLQSKAQVSRYFISFLKNKINRIVSINQLLDIGTCTELKPF